MIENKEFTSVKNIQSYYSDNRVTQSMLKYFLNMEKFTKFIEKYANNSPFYENELYYTEKEHIIIGNGVDTLVTQDTEVFNDQFYVMTTDLPSEKIISICHYIYDRISKESIEILTDLSNYTELIKEAAIVENYYSNYKTETVVNKIITDGSTYFAQLIAANGKTLIDENLNQKIRSISINVLTELDNILYNKLEVSDNSTILGQQFLCTETEKGLADFIIIDHSNKRIHIIDLKTSAMPLYLFNKEIKKYRLDIQLSYYKYLIEKGALNLFLQDDVLNYKISCHIFVNSTTNVYNYKFITLNNALLEIAKTGQKESYCASFYLKDDNISFFDASEKFDSLIKKDKITGFSELLYYYTYFKKDLQSNKSPEEMYKNYLKYTNSECANINIEDVF